MFVREAGNVFRAPKRTLGDLDAEVAAQLLAAASDIALVVDPKGVIRDVALGSDELAQEADYEAWIGKRWVDTVTVESRPKIEELLHDTTEGAPLRWRQVNHPVANGAADLPVRYAAIRIASGRVVAVGRDLRPVAALQQRLVDAQQSMEREYARLRHAETRYRLLFQIAAQPVLIVDSNSLKIVEANPAAGKLLNKSTKRLSGRAFLELFNAESAKTIQSQLAQVRATGLAEELTAHLNEGNQEAIVGTSIFRQESASHFLVRLSPTQADLAQPRSGSKLLRVVESLPDGFVVTDLDRRIITANPAFLDLAELTSDQQARGQQIERWIGRPGVDVGALIANLREHGSVRHFNTIVRGEYGANDEVEISAVSVLTGEHPCYGFTVRMVGARRPAQTRHPRELPRSVEQLTQLVGRVTLKELVRETTDVIERLCIEAALELTGDNRASAAEMLGLSRQSLYSKLRRFGLGDLDSDD